MFNSSQVKKAFDKYGKDVIIQREDKKILQKGFLILEGEKDKRFDFGVLESQCGTFFYSLDSEDLIDGDILEFCGEKYLISNPQKVSFVNKIVYKKVEVEKI